LSTPTSSQRIEVESGRITRLIRGAPLEGKRRDARCSPGCARIMNPGKLLPDP
jgi:hypothetical protein